LRKTHESLKNIKKKTVILKINNGFYSIFFNSKITVFLKVYNKK